MRAAGLGQSGVPQAKPVKETIRRTPAVEPGDHQGVAVAAYQRLSSAGSQQHFQCLENRRNNVAAPGRPQDGAQRGCPSPYAEIRVRPPLYHSEQFTPCYGSDDPIGVNLLGVLEISYRLRSHRPEITVDDESRSRHEIQL